ncbi:MAG: hypothetical protein RL594_17 [Bacteroidota bacterium]|jgi:hypothetical protein
MIELLTNTLKFLNPFIIVIGVISSVLSIIGFFKSRKQAQIATRAANQAVAVRDEMIDRKRLVKTSSLNQRLEAMLDRMIHFGSSATEVSVKGLDRASLARDIEALKTELLKYREDLTQSVKDGLDIHLNTITENLAAFVEAKTFMDMKEHGTILYNCMVQASVIVERHLDEHSVKLSTSVLPEVK